MSTTSNTSTGKTKRAVFTMALAQKTMDEYMRVIQEGCREAYVANYGSIKACGEDMFGEGHGGAASQEPGVPGHAKDITKQADERAVFRTALAQKTKEEFMRTIREGCPEAYVTSYNSIKECGEDRFGKGHGGTASRDPMDDIAEHEKDISGHK